MFIMLAAGVCFPFRSEALAGTFSFAVLADPRGHEATWSNALKEIRDGNTDKPATFTPVELIIVAGDMDPLKSRRQDYLHVFPNPGNRPLLLPVIGNHDIAGNGSSFRYARAVIIPSIPGVIRKDPPSCDYYLDHKNSRIIVIDGYTNLGRDGVINTRGRQWVEQTIKSAPASIVHIFITFHEPAFPRFHHVGNSFDRNREQRNAFWRMITKYNNRVRAVFVGHTHTYYRMRVFNPAGAATSDPNSMPDENGGIYQIDAGAAGSGGMNTIVLVQVNGDKVFFKVIQAKNGAGKIFSKVDEWSTPRQQ